MKINYIAKIKSGQDGAIFGDYLFRFGADGRGKAYSLLPLLNGEDPLELDSLTLDKSDLIVPHSNSVVFGNEYYAEGDEFPLMYTNIYNNYAKYEDTLRGVTCVYRVQREGNKFLTTLVGIIKIGFIEERGLWLSEVGSDIRPYGNFVIDNERDKYYGFVMRDGDKTTRFFEFDMPKLSDGKLDPKYGVPTVTLGNEDIKDSFDTPYINFMQGAVLYGKKIYSVEGFDERIHPAIRVIDLKEKREELFFDLYDAGCTHEPEFIDFYKGKCIYGDAAGNLFELIF